MPTPYAPPVAQLLELGEDKVRQDPWPDYLGLGLTHEHVQELIRMLADAELNEYDGSPGRYWPRIHAWRALGQLRAGEATQPLFRILEEDIDEGWVLEEIPEVLGMIGHPAIAPARALLTRDDVNEFAHSGAMRALRLVALGHPEARDEAMGVMVELLRGWPDHDPTFNAVLINELTYIGDSSTVPLMAAAFEADAVDEMIGGDWEDVQVSMGLIQERITPRPRFGDGLGELFSLRPPALEAPRRRAGPAGKAKKRRKDARAARKRNRRK